MDRKERLLLILATLAGFALLGIIARPISRYFGTDFDLTYLGCVLVAYAAGSAIIAVQWSRLGARLRNLPAAQQAALAKLSPALRYAMAPGQGSLSGRTATLVGAVLINGPLVPIIVGPIFVAQYVFDWQPSALGLSLLLLGFVLAWSWWSVGVTVWRRWAARRGVDPDELQWRGENANLLWSKGHRLEQTELGQLLKRVIKRRLR
jgi:hypothetical protein